MPFAVIVIPTSFAAVKQSYLMAAADLGAGRRRLFRDITLPLILLGLVSAFIFSFPLSLNDFTRSFYLAGRQIRCRSCCSMNGSASPTIYAMSGAIFLLSVLLVSLIALRLVMPRRT
jgi:spermidine/putrescine transport system permease protein